MIIKLIKIGIVLTPFMIFPGMGMREPKEILSLGLALTIVLVALYEGILKPFKNKWVLLFVGFCYISIIFAPRLMDIALCHLQKGKVDVLVQRNIAHIWMYKSYFYIFIYMMMMVAISSNYFWGKQIINILGLMVFCGFLMSLYVFIQHFGLDQFFNVIPPKVYQETAHLDRPMIGGFLGQSTIVAPYIAFLIPLSIYIRRYFFAVCMVGAVCLTFSKVAIFAMTIGLIFYIMALGNRYIKIITILLILVLLLFAIYRYQIKGVDDVINYIKYESSGRFGAWADMWAFFKNPVGAHKQCVTGLGPGSFEWLYSILKDNHWWQAHNDVFEVLLNYGIVGFIFAMLALWTVFKKMFFNHLCTAIAISLGIIIICGLGTFPFQIAPNIFYVVILFGILQNNNIRRIHGY